MLLSRPAVVTVPHVRASINLLSSLDQFTYVPVMFLVLDLCTQLSKDWYELFYPGFFLMLQYRVWLKLFASPPSFIGHVLLLTSFLFPQSFAYRILFGPFWIATL